MLFQDYLHLTKCCIRTYNEKLIRNDDIFSRAFQSIVNAIEKWDEKRGLPLKEFIHLCMTRAIRKELKKMKKKKRKHARLRTLLIDRKQKNPQNLTSLKEIPQIILNSDISETQKIYILDKYFLGLTVKEIAQKSNKSVQSVYFQLGEGLKRLKRNKDLQNIWFSK